MQQAQIKTSHEKLVVMGREVRLRYGSVVRSIYVVFRGVFVVIMLVWVWKKKSRGNQISVGRLVAGVTDAPP